MDLALGKPAFWSPRRDLLVAAPEMEDPVLPPDRSFSLVTVIPVISFHWYHSLTDRAACRERQDRFPTGCLSVG